MKKSVILIISLVLAITGAGYCFMSEDDAGTAGAQFLKLGVGARAAAMGESYAAVSDDSTAVYWNPAGLSRTEGRDLSVMHAVWFEDIFYDWVSYAQDFKCGRIGGAVQYLSYGKITGTDATGLEGDDFTPYDLAVILSYAKEYRGIPLGASLKYIGSKIDDESASAFAVDLGVMKELMEGKFTLGLALQNLGTEMKYDEESDPLPLNIKLGGAYSVTEDILATADINAPSDAEANAGIGGEYLYSVNDDISLSGRAGYTTRNGDTGGTNGVTAGIGVKYTKYNFDYAFAPYGDLGNTHRISLGMKF
ncbi:MAG: PorV/PorQ family protein [Elusimicrobia bacterium]|nr:PorV/PorQ family protein [Elusimicrobiota bacterium]